MKSPKQKQLITLIILFLLLLCALAVVIRLSMRNTQLRHQRELAREQAAEEKRLAEEHSDYAEHVISHRGASKNAIEHSMKAFNLAVKFGSEYIEQDVVLSADGTLYISHDLSANRLTGVNRNYSDMTDKEIGELRTSDGQKILKLSDLFKKYGNTVNYVIEIKSNDTKSADALISLVKSNKLQKKVIVQTTDSGILKYTGAKLKQSRLMLLCKTQEELDAAVKLSYVDIVATEKEFMTEDNAKLVHKKGKSFTVWTLNSEDEIKQAIDLKVDSYFTDDTKLGLQLEEEYGKTHR